MKVDSPRAGGMKSKTGGAECQQEFVNGIHDMREEGPEKQDFSSLMLLEMTIQNPSPPGLPLKGR